MLQKLESLVHVPVKVTPHQTLNSCTGVVWSRELASCDVVEITLVLVIYAVQPTAMHAVQI